MSFLRSYLQDRAQRVFLNGKYSIEGVVKYGVPKGSFLSPLLFCFFVNDLSLHITNNNAVYDPFEDRYVIHSCGADIKSVLKFLPAGLEDVSK